RQQATENTRALHSTKVPASPALMEPTGIEPATSRLQRSNAPRIYARTSHALNVSGGLQMSKRSTISRPSGQNSLRVHLLRGSVGLSSTAPSRLAGTEVEVL